MVKIILLLSVLMGGQWQTNAQSEKPDINTCLENLVDVMANPPDDVDGYAASCVVTRSTDNGKE